MPLSLLHTLYGFGEQICIAGWQQQQISFFPKDPQGLTNCRKWTHCHCRWQHWPRCRVPSKWTMKEDRPSNHYYRPPLYQPWFFFHWITIVNEYIVSIVTQAKTNQTSHRSQMKPLFVARTRESEKEKTKTLLCFHNASRNVWMTPPVCGVSPYVYTQKRGKRARATTTTPPPLPPSIGFWMKVSVNKIQTCF